MKWHNNVCGRMNESVILSEIMNNDNERKKGVMFLRNENVISNERNEIIMYNNEKWKEMK